MDRIHGIQIKDFMTKDVVFLNPQDTLVVAYEKMQTHGVRHLPVVNDQNEVVGVFTQTDLNHACPPHETESGWHYSKSDMSSHILAHFITKEPITLTPEDSLGKAAAVLARNNISCIPIVQPGTKKLAGIIIYIDVLREIGELLE